MLPIVTEPQPEIMKALMKLDTAHELITVVAEILRADIQSYCETVRFYGLSSFRPLGSRQERAGRMRDPRNEVGDGQE